MNEKEMVGVNGDNVCIIHANPLIPSCLGLNVPFEDDGAGSDKDKRHNLSILSPSSLVGRANLEFYAPPLDVDNFIALSQGKEMGQFQLMLRLEPFAAFFFMEMRVVIHPPLLDMDDHWKIHKSVGGLVASCPTH